MLRNRVAIVSLLLALAATCGAAEWQVATNGANANAGTKESPWDIASALEGKHKVQPGDTVWLAPGIYKFPPKNGGQGFIVRLAGTEQAPVHVRAAKGQRVTIDGGLTLQEPSTCLWLWDLEIMVSEPRPDKALPPDPTYANVNRPWGGLNVNAGTGCKFINLVIHDNSQGASWWAGSKDSEMYGCIIYGNGWKGTDRGHGHAIYTQNQDGVKRVTDCIMTSGFGYTLHAYGSARAYVDNYLVERNIAYNAGPFLIGGGRPSHNIQVFSNVLYNVSMQVGYSAKTNEDCLVRGNVILNGDLNVIRFGHPVMENNLVSKTSAQAVTRPYFHPNKYEPSRANLAVYNGEKKEAVEVDLGPWLKPGEKFRLMEPTNFFGAPFLAGVCGTKGIKIPMSSEFGAWVVLKE